MLRKSVKYFVIHPVSREKLFSWEKSTFAHSIPDGRSAIFCAPWDVLPEPIFTVSVLYGTSFGILYYLVTVVCYRWKDGAFWKDTQFLNHRKFLIGSFALCSHFGIGVALLLWFLKRLSHEMYLAFFKCSSDFITPKVYFSRLMRAIKSQMHLVRKSL